MVNKSPKWISALSVDKQCKKPFKTGAETMEKQMKTSKTNGNGKYMKGAEARARARKIYVLRHFGEMTLAQIAEATHLTGERVRQVLKTHKEPSLWLADLSHVENKTENKAQRFAAPLFARISP